MRWEIWFLSHPLFRWFLILRCQFLISGGRSQSSLLMKLLGRCFRLPNPLKRLCFQVDKGESLGKSLFTVLYSGSFISVSTDKGSLLSWVPSPGQLITPANRCHVHTTPLSIAYFSCSQHLSCALWPTKSSPKRNGWPFLSKHAAST